MLSDKVKLTAKDILEKEFKTSVRGYKQEEVDKYLGFYHKRLRSLSIRKLKSCSRKIYG